MKSVCSETCTEYIIYGGVWYNIYDNFDNFVQQQGVLNINLKEQL